MDKKEVAANLGLSEKDLDDLIGKRPIKLEDLNTVASALLTVMGEKNTVQWLKDLNQNLNNKSPLDLLCSESGRKQLFQSIDRWLAGSPF